MPARPFCQAPCPQSIFCSTPANRATSVTASSLAPLWSVIASSFRALDGNTYFLFEPFAGEPEPSRGRNVRLDSVSSSFFRESSSVARGAGFMAGRSLSHTRFRTDCMSFTPLVMAMTASCSGITMQYCPNAPSPR